METVQEAKEPLGAPEWEKEEVFDGEQGPQGEAQALGHIGS